MKDTEFYTQITCFLNMFFKIFFSKLHINDFSLHCFIKSCNISMEDLPTNCVVLVMYPEGPENKVDMDSV